MTQGFGFSDAVFVGVTYFISMHPFVSKWMDKRFNIKKQDGKYTEEGIIIHSIVITIVTYLVILAWRMIRDTWDNLRF